MNELISLLETEIQKTRFGSIQFVLTMHDGEVRCVNITRTTRYNITPKNAKDIENGKERKN